MKKIIIIFIIIYNIYFINNIFCEETNKDELYAIIYGDDIKIFEKPDITSNIIGILNKNNIVKIIDKSKNKIEIKLNNKIIETHLCKIITENNLIGWIFDVYIELQYTINKNDFDIRGNWPLYYDCPNAIYIFKNNNIAEKQYYYCDGTEKIEKGHYSYNGKNKITVNMDNGRKYDLEVIVYNNEITLRFGVLIFTKELYFKNE
jgi:hypothetical protein